MGSGTYKNLNFCELPLKKNRMVKRVIFLNTSCPVVSCGGVPLSEGSQVPWGEAASFGTSRAGECCQTRRGGEVIYFLCNLFNYSNNASFF